jgi:hypothetical protein
MVRPQVKIERIEGWCTLTFYLSFLQALNVAFSMHVSAATTYDITRLLGAATRLTKTIKIVSLLQPSPETVGNFDEVIVFSEGKIIYSGPIDDVIVYFNELGYEIPEVCVSSFLPEPILYFALLNLLAYIAFPSEWMSRTGSKRFPLRTGRGF